MIALPHILFLSPSSTSVDKNLISQLSAPAAMPSLPCQTVLFWNLKLKWTMSSLGCFCQSILSQHKRITNTLPHLSHSPLLPHLSHSPLDSCALTFPSFFIYVKAGFILDLCITPLYNWKLLSFRQYNDLFSHFLVNFVYIGHPHRAFWYSVKAGIT